MGYACPVCDTPQQDAEHLANHLAITGMVRDEAHADWLDDHAEGWRESSPAELGAVVADHAESVDFDRAAVEHADLPADAERVSEEDHDHDHGNGHEHAHGRERTHGHERAQGDQHAADRGGARASEGSAAFPDSEAMADDDVAEIIEEARELTREQFEDAAVEGDDPEDAERSDDADESPAADDES